MKKTDGFSSPVFRKYDLAVIAVILLAAVVIWAFLPRQAGQQGVVRLEGEIVATLPLEQDTSLTVENRGYTLTVCVKNNQIFVSHATCPDQICRNTGAISQQGQTVVCLPAACSVTVEGGTASCDATTY